jgi:AbrB family looped-hinge helix DNA binding protein
MESGERDMALQATRVDAKGRIVLPKETRAELGLEPGDILFVDTDGERRIIYLAKPDNPLDVLAVAALEEDREGLTIDLDDALLAMDTLEPDVDVA